MKKSSAAVLISVSLAVIISVSSVFLLISERKKYQSLTGRIYEDAFLGFLNSSENMCAAISAFQPGGNSLPEMAAESDLFNFYFSRLPVPYGMLSSMSTFFKTSSEYFQRCSEKKAVNGTDEANIEAIKGISARLSPLLSEMKAHFLTVKDRSEAVRTFFDQKNYTAAGQGKSDFSAFYIDDVLYDMPELSYQGELSRHAAGMGFSLLQNAYETDKKQAKEAAAACVGDIISSYQYVGISEGLPACHVFSCGNCYIFVTQKGGYVMELSIACKIYKNQLPEEELAQAAKERVREYGFGFCEAEYLHDVSGIMYFKCMPQNGKEGTESEYIIIGLDREYGNTKYLNAYHYLKFHDLEFAPDGI